MIRQAVPKVVREQAQLCDEDLVLITTSDTGGLCRSNDYNQDLQEVQKTPLLWQLIQRCRGTKESDTDASQAQHSVHHWLVGFGLKFEVRL